MTELEQHTYTMKFTKTINRNLEYRDETIKWTIHVLNPIVFLFHMITLNYLGFFWGRADDLSIEQHIPSWPFFLKKYFLNRTLYHELGHANVHIDHCKKDPDQCQSYHDYYDRKTWHGFKQYKYRKQIEMPYTNDIVKEL